MVLVCFSFLTSFASSDNTESHVVDGRKKKGVADVATTIYQTPTN
jgi:hypothetical protein